MKTYLLLSCVLFSCMLFQQACSTTKDADQESIELSANETATFYVVIVDTNASYTKARAVMLEFNAASQLEIDTLNRYFNTELQQLILAEDDEDEIYRGQYFPRRGMSETLSIEYLDAMMPVGYSGNTFGVVGGIFEEQKTARELVKKWKAQFPKMYVQRTEMYMGCIH